MMRSWDDEDFKSCDFLLLVALLRVSPCNDLALRARHDSFLDRLLAHQTEHAHLNNNKTQNKRSTV